MNINDNQNQNSSIEQSNQTILPNIGNNIQNVQVTSTLNQENLNISNKVKKKKSQFFIIVIIIISLLIIIGIIFISKNVLVSKTNNNKEKLSTKYSTSEQNDKQQKSDNINNRWDKAFDWSKYNIKNNQLSFQNGILEAPLTIEKILPFITKCDRNLKPSDMTRTDLIAYEDGRIEINGFIYNLKFYKENKNMTYGEVFNKNLYDIQTDSWGVAINHDYGDDKENDLEYGIRQLKRVFDEYGLPTYILESDSLPNAPMLFWEKESYRFGLLIMDIGRLGGLSKPSLEIKGFFYIPNEAWNNFLKRWDSYKETTIKDYTS